MREAVSSLLGLIAIEAAPVTQIGSPSDVMDDANLEQTLFRLARGAQSMRAHASVNRFGELPSNYQTFSFALIEADLDRLADELLVETQRLQIQIAG